MMKARVAICAVLCAGLLTLGACGTVHDVNTTSTGKGTCSTSSVDISKAGINNGVLTFTSSQSPNSSIKVQIATDKGEASVIGSVPGADSGIKAIGADGKQIQLEDAKTTSKPVSNGAEMTTTAKIKQLGLSGSLQSLTFTRLDADSGNQTGEGCTIHIK